MNKKTLIAFLIIILIAIGFGIYMLYSGRDTNNEEVKNTVNPNNSTIVYRNTDYGFTFSLPSTWKGYSIVNGTWNGTALTNITAPSGPKIIIRNPKWTAAAHYEDIPVLVFTISQWNSYLAENFSISAAPILASELARNDMYVFALPPRWNFDYSLGYEEAENIVASNPIKTFNSGISLECYNSPKYFAIQKSQAGSVGSDILIKYKTSSGEDFDCAYKVTTGNFEIKNVTAEYFLAFTDNFLVLDKGTAPEPRGLVVYDLRSRKIVFNDSYAKPVEVKGDSITYWSKTTQKPTLQNCIELNNFTQNGLGAVIMSRVTVNLSTLIKVDSGDTLCKATQ